MLISAQHRTTNYQFSFERMLALQGNTAPYLLYAYVRIQGIARQGGSLMATAPGAICLQAPQEFSLARQLLNFDEVILAMEQDLLPNRLCGLSVQPQPDLQPLLRPVART